MTVIHENLSFQQSNGERINLKTIQKILQQESSVSIIGFDEQFQLQKVYITSVQKFDPQHPMLTIKTKKKRVLHLELTARPVIFNTKNQQAEDIKLLLVEAVSLESLVFLEFELVNCDVNDYK